LAVLRERELLLVLRVDPELPFELVRRDDDRLRLDEDDAFGFAADFAFDAAAFGLAAADFAVLFARDDVLREDDERELDERELEERDDDERELDAAADCGLR
jgi:hypothetical protein